MYYARLKKSAQYCKFNDLKGEDDMLLLKLISGIYQMEMKRKVFEANQSDKMDLDTTIEFIKNLEQIGKYTHKQEETMKYVDKNKENNKFRKSSNPTTCGYCGRIHPRGKCPAYGKICNKCQRKNHFAAQCRSQNAHAIESTGSETKHTEECFII